jgi:hypothetical protein
MTNACIIVVVLINIEKPKKEQPITFTQNRNLKQNITRYQKLIFPTNRLEIMKSTSKSKRKLTELKIMSRQWATNAEAFSSSPSSIVAYGCVCACGHAGAALCFKDLVRAVRRLVSGEQGKGRAALY